MDYERCELSDVLYIGRSLATFGPATVRYTGNRAKAVRLPSPQDYIRTVITDCDSEWVITGHTDLEIQGNKIRSGCSLDVQGTDMFDATIFVDFGIDDKSCSDGYAVELDGNVITINGARVEFGSAFKNVVIIGSPCNDVIRIKKTLGNTEVVDIRGGAGSGKLQQVSTSIFMTCTDRYLHLPNMFKIILRLEKQVFPSRMQFMLKSI